MRIAVVDDDQRFAKIVLKAIKENFQSKQIPVTIECFQNGRNLLVQLDEHKMFDVYFLDVEMQYMTGVELAKRIRLSDEKAIIIFLTSHEKYAIDGYSCHAYGYIIKDRWKENLPDILGQIQRKEMKRQERIYFIQTERKYEKIYIDDIYYLEKNGKNVFFYCKGEKIYQERASLGDVYKKLPHNEFIYVNRGQVANLKYVTHVDAEKIELDDYYPLAISRRNLSEIRNQLMEYWRIL